MSSSLPVGVAAYVVKYGQNQLSAIDDIVLRPQPPPLLSELADGDIVVGVRATEIVWTDTVMATGQYQHQARLPYSPGMTYSGVILITTPLAKQHGLSIGDSVAVAGIDAGPRSLGRYQKWGGCASYAVAPYTAVRRFPSSWSFPQAASFAYGYDTAFHCLIERGNVQKGESILIHGASGGVGIPAVHIAVMLGLTVYATTRTRSKVKFLEEMGVREVIVLGETPQFHSHIKEITQQRGVDIVYDGVGGDDITVESLRALRFGGRFLIVGWASTPNVAAGGGKRGAPNANRIPTNLIMMKCLTILGCPAMISLRHNTHLYQQRVATITEWLLKGKLPPPLIAETFHLKDIKEAMKARVASGSQVGSTIVLISDNERFLSESERNLSESERKESERKESESERKESERKESERKESERKESERTESERKLSSKL
jgi:NADPH:quinone reductase